MSILQMHIPRPVPCRSWRAHLKEWLAVVAAVKAPKNLRQADRVLLAVASLLTDLDPTVQQAVLKCFKVQKLTATALPSSSEEESAGS